ncbi:peptidylprolyl isomerase [bacterium]|nr:peptidylprolyl isomerase [bacterium]MBU1066031.1 peptidylprolyl isomerase [bacterium]MBU1633084.1 peptidylprolyl isomerase [bacterium]MBU1874296.1 peptidylprolyl isomerase [bacterium]
MKKTLIIILSLYISFSFSQEIIDGIAAIVGENIILKSDVDQFARMNASQLGIDPSRDPGSYQRLINQALQSLIDENILLEQAKIETIDVKDREVETMLEQQIENILFQAGSKENAEKILGSPLNKVRRDYRPIIKNRLIVEKLRNDKFSQITITRREVDEFYTVYRDSLPKIPSSVDFSQILFKIKAGQKEEKNAKFLADSLYQAIQSGIDFAELAGQYSDDPASAAYGGDLGFISRGGFIKEFEEVAFSLTINEISNVVKTDFGYHIIQLLDRKGENINVRHILIKPETSDNNLNDLISKIDSVRNLLITNQIPFDSAAVLFSDDPDVKSNNGRIHRISKSQIQQPEFLTVLDTIKIGDVSQVFTTNMGYHILKLNTIYDDSWAVIEKWALEYKKSLLYDEWITKLRSKFNIEMLIGE